MKLLIVDDEIIIRTGLSTVIPWREHGFTLLPPAASAEEALARFPVEKPHIILTDIQMHGKSGLDMAEEIKASHPETEIIVLSGHDEFAYAQRALRQGIGDYILKTSRPDEIIKVALGAKRRLMDRQEERRRGLEQGAVLRSGALEDLLFRGRLPADGADLGRLFPQLYPKAEQQVRTVIWSALPSGNAPADEGMRAALRDELDRLFPDAVVLEWRAKMLSVIRSKAPGNGNELPSAIAVLEETLGVPVFAAAGSPAEGLEQVHASFQEARHALRYSWLMDHSGYADYDELKGREGGELDFPQEEELRLLRILKTGNPEEVRTFVQEWCGKIKKSPGATLDSVQTFVQLLLLTSSRWLEQAAAGYGWPPETARVQLPGIERLLEDPDVVLSDVLEKVMNKYAELTSGTNRLISEAVAYIREHYAKSLTLQQLARHIHVNPNYLSDLFKKETGRSYTEWITHERMERAMALLRSTDAKVSEVARSVGYEDVKYFTQLFKRHTGTTPSGFR